jgi:hypothetical protein
VAVNIYLLRRDIDFEKPPMIRKRMAGQTGRTLLIKSEPPERESARASTPKGAEEIRSRKDLIESETQDRREAPGGKPERVSTKEASVP